MLPATVGVLACMLFLAPSAFAGVGGSIVPQLTSPGVVSATANVNGSLVLSNQNNFSQAGDSNQVTSIGFVPACALSAFNTCATFSPGSIVLNPGSATGAAGSSCAGVTFAISAPDSNGAVTLTPSSTITLPPGSSASAECTINFTYKVLKLPTNDANPSVPGQYQTHQFASFGFRDVTANLPGTATGTSIVVIADAPPTCSIPAHGGSPGSVAVTTQEPNSGISTISFTTINATVGVSPAATLTSGDTSNGTYTYTPPQTGLVTVTATRTTPGVDSRLDMVITDAAGVTNAVNCDPISSTARAGGIAKAHTIKRVSRDMRFLSVANGRPGLRKINIAVNGRRFKTVAIGDGKHIRLNLAKALTRKSNTVTISGRGKSKATAEIMIANVK